MDVLRLFLHITAATIWVGGQLTLAALVPALRSADAEAPRAAARAFRRVAWPAFGVLVLTGIWNVVVVNGEENPPSQANLGIKYALVLVSGVSAFLHERSTSKRGLAVWGAVAGLSAVLAVLWGVVLAEG
jgi:putative copper export protein